MYPSTNTQSGSTDNLTIYTEATTITTMPSNFVNQASLETKIQDMITRFDEKCEKQHEELVKLTSMFEDNKLLKEDYIKFSSKIDENKRKLSYFNTYFYERLEEMIVDNRVSNNIE